MFLQKPMREHYSLLWHLLARPSSRGTCPLAEAAWGDGAVLPSDSCPSPRCWAHWQRSGEMVMEGKLLAAKALVRLLVNKVCYSF